MMKTFKQFTIYHALILVCCLAAGSPAVADEPPSKYQLAQQAADEAYNHGDYDLAYRKYVNLARKGDSFSQYRLSYMYYQGQGVEKDMAEAYGWAVLAAQGNNPTLLKYLVGLAKEVPAGDTKRANIKANNYLNKWGNLVIAEDARRGAIRVLRECTGSRLGTRCEEVYSMQMPSFWDINRSHSPFIGDKTVKGSTSYTTGNGAGGPVLNVPYYQAIRWGVVDINDYMLSNAHVEIGELETVPDTTGTTDQY